MNDVVGCRGWTQELPLLLLLLLSNRLGMGTRRRPLSSLSSRTYGNIYGGASYFPQKRSIHRGNAIRGLAKLRNIINYKLIRVMMFSQFNPLAGMWWSGDSRAFTKSVYHFFCCCFGLRLAACRWQDDRRNCHKYDWKSLIPRPAQISAEEVAIITINCRATWDEWTIYKCELYI